MKKLCLLLALCLLASMLFTVPAFAETEEDNSGTVFVVENDGAETADLPEIAETEAFVRSEGFQRLSGVSGDFFLRRLRREEGFG